MYQQRHTGFNVPPGYFKEQQELLGNDSYSHTQPQAGYTVPDGYFGQQEAHLLSQIPPLSRRQSGIVKLLKPFSKVHKGIVMGIAGIAAAVCILFAAPYVLQPSTQSIQDLDNQQLMSYLSTEEVYYSYSVQELLPTTGNTTIDFIDNDNIDDIYLMDYLLEQEVPQEILLQ